MNTAKLDYATPVLVRVGGFETVTLGGTDGRKFDGNFSAGDLVPVDENGNPLIFS